MRHMSCLAIALGLVICTAACAPLGPTTLPFFGEGYRGADDPCRRVGESIETADYLDHTADLVGCPARMENLSAFVDETGAVEAFRQDGYVIYSVPRG